MVVGYDPNTKSIISTWRGTSNVKNWIEDADFFKTSYTRSGCSGCNVHRGFLAAYESLKSNYLSHV
jgi:hypothetical protein